MKKLLVLGLSFTIFASAAVYASAATLNPAEIYANLRGITVEEALEERNTDETFGQLAEENGLLEDFKKEMLEERKGLIDEYVQEGKMTEEEGNTYKELLEERAENCDPSNPQRIGNGLGLGGGCGTGLRRGYNGNVDGTGAGMGRGMGRGARWNR